MLCNTSSKQKYKSVYVRNHRSYITCICSWYKRIVTRTVETLLKKTNLDAFLSLLDTRTFFQDLAFGERLTERRSSSGLLSPSFATGCGFSKHESGRLPRPLGCLCFLVRSCCKWSKFGWKRGLLLAGNLLCLVNLRCKLLTLHLICCLLNPHA